MSDEVVLRSTVLDELEKIETANDCQRELVKMTNSAAGLLSSVPMVCKTERCPYASGCPLYCEGVAIAGERCPIETDLVRAMFVSYCRQLEINPDYDKVEAGLVKDLCSVEIQALRANKLMSFENFLVEVVDAIDPATGDVYYKKDLHIAVSWSERLLNQKLRILESLVASPMAKLKYRGDSGIQDLQKKMGELKKRMESLMPSLKDEEEAYIISSYESHEED